MFCFGESHEENRISPQFCLTSSPLLHIDLTCSQPKHPDPINAKGHSSNVCLCEDQQIHPAHLVEYPEPRFSQAICTTPHTWGLLIWWVQRTWKQREGVSSMACMFWNTSKANATYRRKRVYSQFGSYVTFGMYSSFYVENLIHFPYVYISNLTVLQNCLQHTCETAQCTDGCAALPLMGHQQQVSYI